MKTTLIGSLLMVFGITYYDREQELAHRAMNSSQIQTMDQEELDRQDRVRREIEEQLRKGLV